MCLGAALFESILLRVHWTSWTQFNGFHQRGKVFDHYFFQYVFCHPLSLAFLLGFLLCLCWCTYIPTVKFWSLLSSFFLHSFFFLFLRLDDLNWIQSLIPSFASSNLLMNTSIKFFICFIILSNAKISTLLYSENNVYFFNDIVSLVTHHPISFISLNIF